MMMMMMMMERMATTPATPRTMLLPSIRLAIGGVGCLVAFTGIF
jgi:hypothetical protein